MMNPMSFRKMPSLSPKKTLLAQGAFMIWKNLVWWEILLVIMFILMMMVLPFLTNWMNVQMVQGKSESLAIIFASIRILEVLIDSFRDCYLLSIASKLQECFIRNAITHYSSLSKTSRSENQAFTIIKFIQDASWSINHLVEWGLFAIGSMVGQSISAAILLFIFDLDWVDYIVLPIGVIFAIFIIRTLQAKLTIKQQVSREIDEKITDLLQLKCNLLQNGNIQPSIFIEYMIKPIIFNNKLVRPMYNYIGRTLDIVISLIILAYAWVLPDDRTFAAKFVLIRTISSALNSATHFGSQYNRYCNDYEKYRKLHDKELQYDEKHVPLQLPHEGLQIREISIHRGENYIIKGTCITFRPGHHYLIQGPSGSGKTSFVEALRGFIDGVSLVFGVAGNFSHHILMHTQNYASSVQLYSISLADLFDTNDSWDFERIRKLLTIVFEEAELTRILNSISITDPFQTKIEGKLSGGQQQRLFIALTLLNQERENQSICIFDELDAGLDPSNRCIILRKLYSFLKERNITAIWITHMCDCELQKCGIDFDGGRLFFQQSENGCDIKCVG